MTVPRLERIKGALNFDFLPLYGATARDLEFDYESPVPDDEAAENAELTAKVDAVVALVREGFDPKAALAAVGLPDIAFLGGPPPPSEPLKLGA
jgi:hypothetical protein